MPRCISELRKILGDRARSPLFIKTLPKRGYQFIAEVDGVRSAALRRRAIPISLAVAALLTVLYGAAFRETARPGAGGEPAGGEPAIGVATTPARDSIAVFSFKNIGAAEETQWLPRALQVTFSTELDSLEDYTSMPTEVVRRFFRGRVGSAQVSLGAGFLREFGLSSGADVAVLGTYLLQERAGHPTVRVDVRLQDLRSGEKLWSNSFEHRLDHVSELARRAGFEMRRFLADESEVSRSGIPSDSGAPWDRRALELYSRGREHLDRLDPNLAINTLEAANGLEPGRSLVLMALAESWHALGHTKKATDYARAALAASAGLPSQNRRWIEAWGHEISGRWDEAVSTFSALAVVFPDNVEYQIRVFSNQLELGRYDAARLTSERLSRRPSGQQVIDHQIALKRVELALLSGHLPEARMEVSALLDTARSSLDQAMVGRAEFFHGMILAKTGEATSALAAFYEARDIFHDLADTFQEARVELALAQTFLEHRDFTAAQPLAQSVFDSAERIGDLRTQAKALNVLAEIAAGRRDGVLAEELSRRALAILVESGNRRERARQLGRLGVVLGSQGRLEEAVPYFQQEVEAFKDLNSLTASTAARSNLGRCYLLLGRISTALPMLRQAATESAFLHDDRLRAKILFNLGNAASMGGVFDEAHSASAEAAGLFRSMDNPTMRATALNALGNLLLAAGRVAEARAALEESVRIHQDHSQGRRDLFPLASLSHWYLETGNAVEAEDRARGVLQSPGLSRQRVPRLQVAVAMALVAQGRMREALGELPRQDLTPPSEMTLSGAWYALHAERIRALGGDSSARLRLAAHRDAAASVGAWKLTTDAQLALAEVAIDSTEQIGSLGKSEEADLADLAGWLEQLAQVEGDARDRGWLLIAQKAKSLLERGRKLSAEAPSDRLTSANAS